MNILIELVREHFLAFTFFGFLFVLTLALGLLEDIEIGGEVLIVFAKFFKRRLRGIVAVACRLRKELSTWDGNVEE